ncbi:hypothetical protein N7G274_007809 [Stereocaulon virgatum]|uniref:Glycosyltransferase family 32 protein n=1 Tax=Stereocaulon virgatum TaxID=373712 RepID=A0ABR4A0S0_9LECA
MAAYEELETEIFCVDAAHHIYMHVFGGVYADLDTECLRPYDSMFERYNTSTTPHNAITLSSDASSSLKNEAEKSSIVKDRTSLKLRNKSQYVARERKTFLGRMGTDEEFPPLNTPRVDDVNP